MMSFLIWCILLVLCWPLALLAIILYPFVWLILLPFRLLGFAVDLSFSFIRNLVMLPFTLVGKRG
ncbi:hypothetical protein [Aquiflexum lacus]|uniref:hypothetical protein n=1 Tax=Aquiflexum lacus TaxID=2483805 RepID=UPI0018954EB2|nr:hypothetical protein [Aquiflexum lacus]